MTKCDSYRRFQSVSFPLCRWQKSKFSIIIYITCKRKGRTGVCHLNRRRSSSTSRCCGWVMVGWTLSFRCALVRLLHSRNWVRNVAIREELESKSCIFVSRKLVIILNNLRVCEILKRGQLNMHTNSIYALDTLMTEVQRRLHRKKIYL